MRCEKLRNYLVSARYKGLTLLRFASVGNKGVTCVKCVSADSKGVADFRVAGAGSLLEVLTRKCR